MRLTDEQLDWLCERVPDAPVSPKGDKPAMSKRDALRVHLEFAAEQVHRREPEVVEPPPRRSWVVTRRPQ
jgi:hypothetical protein